MRAQSPETYLAYELKRRPELAALYDRIDEASIEEIESFSYPMKWIKDIFLAHKSKEVAMRNQLEAFARLMKHINENGKSRDVEGRIILWVGQETYLKMNSGLISIRENRYLFMPNEGGVYNDNVYSKFVDPRIYQEGRPHSQGKLSEYKELCRQARNNDCPIDAPIIDLTGGSSTSSSSASGGRTSASMGLIANYGVKFS